MIHLVVKALFLPFARAFGLLLGELLYLPFRIIGGVLSLPLRGTGSRRTRRRRKRKVAVRRTAIHYLIEDGILKPPVELRRSYKGREFSATIQKNGSVRFNNRICTSLSNAAAKARAIALGKNLNRPPATNGWTFWEYFDAGSRKWKSLAELKRRYDQSNTRVITIKIDHLEF